MSDITIIMIIAIILIIIIIIIIEEQADSLDEEDVAIVMLIAEVIEKGRKDKLQALRNVPKKKLLEEPAEDDKVLSKFKTHSITRTNELLYAGAAVVTNR